jgi:hypothetical protein
LKHFRLSSRNIINDLRKNLARFGVAGDVSLINGRSFDEATISEIRQRLSNGDVGLFVFDADNNVRRDLDSYGELLNDGCLVVIDDYLGPQKQRHSGRRLTPLCAKAGSFRLDITHGDIDRPMAAGMTSVTAWRQGRLRRVARNHFVLSPTKSVDKEPLHSESQHSFLPCSHRNLFHPSLQAACRLFFNSRPRRSAPFVPCAI